jgi:hypothetical protein
MQLRFNETGYSCTGDEVRDRQFEGPCNTGTEGFMTFVQVFMPIFVTGLLGAFAYSSPRFRTCVKNDGGAGNNSSTSDYVPL